MVLLNRMGSDIITTGEHTVRAVLPSISLMTSKTTKEKYGDLHSLSEFNNDRVWLWFMLWKTSMFIR